MRLALLLPSIVICASALFGLKLYNLTPKEDNIDRMPTASLRKPTPSSPLVQAFETMPARDAARLFDNLDTQDLTEIARQLKPSHLSDILSLMKAEKSEKLLTALLKK